MKEMTQAELQALYDKLTPLERLTVERAKGMLWGYTAIQTQKYLDLCEELE